MCALVDSVPFARMPLVFAKAAVYINTSVAAYEGFPNVFLQAAASGVPIASLELDHDFVERGRCGLVAHGDLERLAEYVRTVCNDRRERDEEAHAAANTCASITICRPRPPRWPN